MKNSKYMRIIAFTSRGAKLGANLKSKLMQAGYTSEAFTMSRFVDSGLGLKPLESKLTVWAKESFEICGGIVFISACGLAVRAIAPYIQEKSTDPAVVVIDENGKYVIPILAGHVGGGNDLAREIAKLIHSEPVITTATDINNKFAVDEWAAKNHFYLSSKETAKRVSARLLEGKSVGVYSEFPSYTVLPDGLTWAEEGALGISLSYTQTGKPFADTLHLIPKTYTLGIGCKKGTKAEEIAETVEKQLRKWRVPMEAIEAVASIDLKCDEPGLKLYCQRHRLPFYTYSAEELNEVTGDFTPSEFVNQVVGVDNVCERAAVLHSKGKLLQQKAKGKGTTLALAAREPLIQWENKPEPEVDSETGDME